MKNKKSHAYTLKLVKFYSNVGFGRGVVVLAVKVEECMYSHPVLFAINLLQRGCYHPDGDRDICALVLDLST